LCKKAAVRNQFPSTAHWFRAIISGHLHMMGWRRLKPVSGGRNRRLICKRGHDMTPENVTWRTMNGKRIRLCRRCQNDRYNAYMQRRRKAG
jgi:hypothetical protein